MMIYRIGRQLFKEKSLDDAIQNAFIEEVFTEKLDITEYVHKLIKYANFSIVTDKKTGQLIAYAAFYDNNEKDKIAYLSFIYVSKLFRGQGISSDLLNFIVKHLKEKGFKYFKLEVRQDNKPAIQVYEQNVFKKISVTESGSYIMQLEL